MSAIRNLARIPRTPVFAAQRMGFQTSALRLAGKESKLHDENRPEEIEQHKQDMLKKAKEGRGQWKDELASDSESIVKADRGEIEASEDTIKGLQKETEQLSKKMHEKK